MSTLVSLFIPDISPSHDEQKLEGLLLELVVDTVVAALTEDAIAAVDAHLEAGDVTGAIEVVKQSSPDTLALLAAEIKELRRHAVLLQGRL